MPTKQPATMTDAQGREVPTQYVQKYDRQRDRVVRSLHGQAVKLHEQIVKFRETAKEKIFSFVDSAAAQHGVSLGGQRGNITLRSFDGLVKVQLAIQDRIEFDEQLAIAQQLITEYLEEISKGADPALVQLVHKAFYADQRGRLRTNAVLGLRTLHIKHAKWIKAMEIIMNSIVVQASKQYVRIYTRESADADWQLIPLNIAAA